MPSTQLLRGRSNQLAVSLESTAQFACTVTRAVAIHDPFRLACDLGHALSDSALSKATRPGFQYSASSETKGMPVISDSRRANVDLPDPDDPMTRTRCIGSVRG